MGWSLVINMPPLERASLLVRATGRDREAVPGRVSTFGASPRHLAVLPFPLLKSSLPHPVTAGFPPERAKIVPSFTNKEQRGKEKEGDGENQMGQTEEYTTAYTVKWDPVCPCIQVGVLKNV